ncbi:hypothetical protein EC1094V2_4991 (plasmid) [Escherichia coli]|nr:hypothetical protein EC1094V2_4991 [Escherichia coli]
MVNQHRVGKRICRALQQRCFGLVMATPPSSVRTQALGSMRANVIIQRCTGELIAQRRQQLFFIANPHL